MSLKGTIIIAGYFRGVYISRISRNENFREDCTSEVAMLVHGCGFQLISQKLILRIVAISKFAKNPSLENNPLYGMYKKIACTYMYMYLYHHFGAKECLKHGVLLVHSLLLLNLVQNTHHQLQIFNRRVELWLELNFSLLLRDFHHDSPREDEVGDECD